MDKPGKNIKAAIESCTLQSIQDLREFLPVDAIYLLIKNYGGCSLYLPKFDQLQKLERNEQINAEYNSGVSIRVLSRKYRLTERQIRSIIKP